MLDKETDIVFNTDKYKREIKELYTNKLTGNLQPNKSKNTGYRPSHKIEKGIVYEINYKLSDIYGEMLVRSIMDSSYFYEQIKRPINTGKIVEFTRYKNDICQK